MAYTTLAEVKTYLDITSSDDDTLISDLISSAQTAIDEYVGFAFEPSDTTEQRAFSVSEDTEGRWLFFDSPAAAITTVLNDADAASPDTVAASDYVTVPRNSTPYYAIKLLENSGVIWTYSNDPETGIAVTADWAYSATPPDDINYAARRLVAFMYRKRESQDNTDRPLLTGDGVTILPSQVPSDIKTILNRYRQWNVGFR